jgi:hypothetical protein
VKEFLPGRAALVNQTKSKENVSPADLARQMNQESGTPRDADEKFSYWATPLPEAIVKRWEQWRNRLMRLELMKIERCFKPKDFGEVKAVQLEQIRDHTSPEQWILVRTSETPADYVSRGISVDATETMYL